jgi:UDP-2,4-diacetamido-2,4,6-trideoxy-beta-L-altropyranose hydrolase
MKTVFRADASTEIGTGHVMRCLTLAERLRTAGHVSHFICRDLPGNLVDFIEGCNFQVHLLPAPAPEVAGSAAAGAPPHAGWLGVSRDVDARDTADALQWLGADIDWLVVDHYAIDALWETGLRPFATRIMAIDDVADRSHVCDLLLDQNLYREPELRYRGKVGGDCRLLLGPRYALLREEFSAGRRYPGKRTGSVGRILVFFGGADPENVTGKALDAIRSLQRADIQVDVIIGSSNPHREALERQCSHMENMTCYFQVTNMAEFMDKADLALGGGGTTTWERCAMALPAVVISLARNQQTIAEAVASTGAITYLGPSAEVAVEDIRDALAEICSHPEKLQEQGRISGRLVDGRGAERVVAEMVNDV